MLTTEEMKKLAGESALDYIRPGMTIGLGTGSTVYYFIEALARRVAEGFPIRAVPTSSRTAELARLRNIPLIDPQEAAMLDLTVDGADEIDQEMQLIKGGGGALLREKIVAAASRELLIIADAGKLVERLGAFPLPVETIPFGWTHTQRHITGRLACPQVLLRRSAGQPFLTDHGNYILDCHFGWIRDAVAISQELNAIPGVAENGLFIGMADRVLLGRSDGTLMVMERRRG
ncbi:MAG TPA: ribose-5-phosphate isomerase RpiA [Chitinophagaceae bacterium]|nr:ribose-5-phosphate isomerase RpiA [Chitinophagaceae bacterium]